MFNGPLCGYGSRLSIFTALGFERYAVSAIVLVSTGRSLDDSPAIFDRHKSDFLADRMAAHFAGSVVPRCRCIAIARSKRRRYMSKIFCLPR